MMRRIMHVAIVILAVCTAGSVLAANIPLSGDQPVLNLTQESKAALAFHVEVGQIQTMDVNTKGGVFTRLIIPGFHTSKVEGSPELPMMNQLISIPVGASSRVQVGNVVTTRIKLADYGVEHPIMPAQPSMSKSADPDKVAFIYDTAAYNMAEIRRDPAKVIYQGRLRAMDVGRLEISPVAYYPASNEIEVIESMDVTVSFDGVNTAAETDLIASTYSPFFENLYSGIAGAKGFHDSYPDRVGDIVTMVVVTPPMFASQLQDFVDWKTERGFHMILAVTGTPEVGTTATEIEAYLHGLYNNATPELPAPSFVLFVGDVDQMPTFTLNGDASDRPYCAVDGDLVPDMYYGRFSATNPSELQAQLDKTMMYDQFTMPDPSYLDKVTLIAGVDSGWAPTHGNGQINYGTENYFNASHGLTSNTYLYPASDGPVEGAILQEISDGLAFINYTAHGSETGWYDPSIGQSDLNSLTNDGKYTMAIGNCCLTSTYDYGECFGETFLRAPNKGAIGYIGGSNSTYWDEDYWWGVGYHPASQIDGTAWPYESTGLGAYDGLFHDHGEAETQWYVTNDALVFCGNLAVMESGSSRIEYYWNIYNLLGDPSLSTYLAPVANPVNHPATVFVGTPDITIDAAVGSYVGLTQNGVLMGAGTVGASGSVDISYLDTLTPGVPMKLVVTAQNKIPYITDLNVIVPATVTIDPMVIDVNTPTDITVTVMDAGGTMPQAGINIWAEGLGYATTPVMTDAGGVAVINVTAPYGPTLDIAGQDPAEAYRLFTQQITVNAADLTAPDLTVSTDIGLSDAFALNLPGTLHATVGEAGYTLFAQMPGGNVLSAVASDLIVTPGEMGVVNGIIALSGYNVYQESFDVIEAYGSIAGVVSSGGTPMADVTVKCLDTHGGSVFTVTTGADGSYASPEDILVDNYSLVVDHFGYLHYEQGIFVNYGANTFDIDLAPASSGVLSGLVMDSVSFDPLQGTVKVYRSDTGDLFTETTCAADGTFTTAALPYFTYNIEVRAFHHVPANISMVIEQPTTVKNFALTPTEGDMLVIDDGAKSYDHDVKMGGKLNDTVLAEAYNAPPSKSAAQMAADLEDMGYFVKMVSADVADPATFWDYDLVVLSCGNNTTTLENAALKTGLINFAMAGGHLLLEGGELGYDNYSDADFATYVMHTNDWNHDSSGDIDVNDAGAYILNHPNTACGGMALTYSGYGDSDAMVPLADAAMPMNWTDYPTDASVITYDPNPAPEGGQIVFFTWNYMAVDAGRYSLLENAVLWLLTPEVGTSSISGQALLTGMTDHSGITITATPNGGTTVTGADGMFTFPGLYAGTYTLHASKPGWSTMVQDVTLAEGQNLTGVSFLLTPVDVQEACNSPALAIPDNGQVTDMVAIPLSGTISAVEAFVDITHTWRGDLIVSLTSPSGTTVVLHNRTGSMADDIYGWYPADLTPDGNLDDFIGEEMVGPWTLTVSDNAGGDTGTLNEWCVKVTYAGGVVAVGVQPMEASAVTGGMALSWEYDTSVAEGFNVYRRVPGASAQRLNDHLLTSQDGAISFVDDGQGLENGQTVFYSYALVHGGVEVSFSEELQATFNAGTPTAFALRGNYPNPFNPMTTIKFDLPRASHVIINIYDVAGRLVRTLVNSDLPAATHAEIWDGTDNSGRSVSSGAYYYQLVTDSRTATAKMLLLK